MDHDGSNISAQGDPLETLAATVDFEMFRPVLIQALGRPPRWKGGRPPVDPVLKFRMLVLQSLHGLSLEQTEYPVRDRLSWMRFCQLGPDDRIAAGALDSLFGKLNQAITPATTYTSTLPRGGQIVEASLVAAPRQRNTDGESEHVNATGPDECANAIREGKSAAGIWPNKPAKARQSEEDQETVRWTVFPTNVDGRWTVKYSKAKVRADGLRPIARDCHIFCV